MDRTLTDPKAILDFVSVQSAIDFTATTDAERGELQERAVAAVTMAIQLEDQNTKALSDEALGIIATAVVGGMNAKDAALAGYQTLVSYFGSTGVPDQLPTTWAKSWNNWKEEKQPGSPLIPEITKERGTELVQVQNTAAAVDQAVMDAEEVHKALGRIEGLEFLRRVGDVAIAQVFAEVRKSKKYKGLPYKDEDGNIRHVEDFKEFCKVKLGKSYTRCYELSQNLTMLGTDLYESAERIGFRAMDYRALKALPPEEQAVIKEAIASESKDQVVDILQDMAARHQTEKEAAKREKDDMSADLEARSKLLADKAERLEETEGELFKLKSLPPNANLELKLAREEEAVKALDQVFVSGLAGLNALFMQVDAIICNEDVALHTKQYAVQTVQMLCQDVQQNLANYGIPVDFEEIVTPAWMRGTAKADLEAGRTEATHESPESD